MDAFDEAFVLIPHAGGDHAQHVAFLEHFVAQIDGDLDIVELFVGEVVLLPSCHLIHVIRIVVFGVGIFLSVFTGFSDVFSQDPSFQQEG